MLKVRHSNFYQQKLQNNYFQPKVLLLAQPLHLATSCWLIQAKVASKALITLMLAASYWPQLAGSTLYRLRQCIQIKAQNCRVFNDIFVGFLYYLSRLKRSGSQSSVVGGCVSVSLLVLSSTRGVIRLGSPGVPGNTTFDKMKWMF